MQDGEGNAVEAILDNGNGTIIYKYSGSSYRGARADGQLMTMYCSTLNEVKLQIANVLVHERAANQ